MKLFKAALLAFGIGFVVKKVSQANDFVDQLTWKFNSVKVDFNQSLMSGFSNIYLTLNISFSNTTDFAIDVSGLTCAVSYNGYPVGTINDSIPFSVLPKTDTNLLLPVVVQVDQASNIITQLINNLQSMVQTVSFEFKGNIVTGLGSFNFDETKVLS
jgi:LEA14-like dessication related protein